MKVFLWLQLIAFVNTKVHVEGKVGGPGKDEPKRGPDKGEATNIFENNDIEHHFGTAAASDISAPLSERVHVPPNQTEVKQVERPGNIYVEKDSPPIQPDGALNGETEFSANFVLKPERTWEGIRNTDNSRQLGLLISPPDPVGDVGEEYYLQAVSSLYAFYDKNDGTLVHGPFPLGTIWENFAVRDCSGNDGNPIVIHDQFSGLFLISQFTTGCEGNRGLCYQCLAATAGPFSNVFRYAFSSNIPGRIGDYPKMGVWGDSIVITTNEFDTLGLGGLSRVGNGVLVINRNDVISGANDARFVYAAVPWNFNPTFGMLPADNDGNNQPPPGSPIPLMVVYNSDSNEVGSIPVDGLGFYEVAIDWNAASFSFNLAAFLPVASFNNFDFCGRQCITQPGVDRSASVDAVGDRLMHRLAYRNFGDYESMVVVHTVFVEETGGAAGSRWYETRRVFNDIGTSSYSIYQQQTFAPNDGINRWMGSIAQDKEGNMALGYSVSNGNDVFPGIRFTGRLNQFTPGYMSVNEGIIIDGTGAQTDTEGNRWGEHSSMNVDPVDGCTFYYTNMYYTSQGQNACSICWQTRIGVIKFKDFCN